MFSRFIIVDWNSNHLTEGHKEYLCKRLARVTNFTSGVWRTDLDNGTRTISNETVEPVLHGVFCILDTKQRLEFGGRGNGDSLKNKPVAMLVAETTPGNKKGRTQGSANFIIPHLDSAPIEKQFRETFGGRSLLEELGTRAVQWSQQNECDRVTVNPTYSPELFHDLARMGLISDAGIIHRKPTKPPHPAILWWKRRRHTHKWNGFGPRKK